MYTKIFVVSLVQVALARHFLDGTFFRTEYNTGHQFGYPGYQFGNPGQQNIRLHSVDAYSDGNYRSGHYERYVENYNDAIFQHGNEQTNYEIREHERPHATLNSQNANRRDRYIGDPYGQDVTDFEYISVNPSNQRHHYRTYTPNNNRANFQKHNQMRYDTQNTLKTNIDTHSNVRDNSSNPSTEYNTRGIDSSYYQNEEVSVKTNEKSNNDPDDSRVFRKPARTNFNIHSRSGDSQSSIDGQSEVRRNGDSMIFIDKDNPTPNEPVKTTTDNELRHNTSDDIKEDKWVWDAPSTTQPTTTENSSNKTGTELDDRTSFNGDACPKGQAKILGQCIDKH